TLMGLPTLRASIIGGFMFRLGVGALPFLLPLLMQIGFGLTPFQSGLVTFGSSAGAMGMKTLAARIIRTFGFRNLMTVNAVISSIFLAACAACSSPPRRKRRRASRQTPSGAMRGVCPCGVPFIVASGGRARRRAVLLPEKHRDCARAT